MSENKEKKEKKPFKVKSFLLIALMLVFAIGAVVIAYYNIHYAKLSNGENANFYTAVSGWVSGVATIVLGAIAIFQNKKYEKDNEHYINEQKKLQRKIADENERQNELNLRNLDYNELKEYRDDIAKDISAILGAGISIDYANTLIDIIESKREKIINVVIIKKYTQKQIRAIFDAITKILISQYNFKEKYDLLDDLIELMVTLNDSSEEFIKNIEDEDEFYTLVLKYFKIFDGIENKMNTNWVNYLLSMNNSLKYLYNQENKNSDCRSYINKITEVDEKSKERLNNINEKLKKEKLETENGQDENGN